MLVEAYGDHVISIGMIAYKPPKQKKITIHFDQCILQLQPTKVVQTDQPFQEDIFTKGFPLAPKEH